LNAQGSPLTIHICKARLTPFGAAGATSSGEVLKGPMPWAHVASPHRQWAWSVLPEAYGYKNIREGGNSNDEKVVTNF